MRKSNAPPQAESDLNAFLTYVNLSWDTIVAGILSPQPPALGRQGEGGGARGGAA